MDPGWEICKDVWLEFLLDSGGGIRKGFWLEIWNSPRLGESEMFLVGKREGGTLGGAGGDLFRRSERGCHLAKRTGPGLVNVRIGC